MREMGFPNRIVSLIEELYSEQQSVVRTDSGTTYWFRFSKCVRQGCIMSPQLFSVYTESIMREVEEEQNQSEYDELSVGGTKITELRCRWHSFYSLQHLMVWINLCRQWINTVKEMKITRKPSPMLPIVIQIVVAPPSGHSVMHPI